MLFLSVIAHNFENSFIIVNNAANGTPQNLKWFSHLPLRLTVMMLQDIFDL